MADQQGETAASELGDLFQYVHRYTPVEYRLDFHFKPFLPDYVPSLGQVDDQIKVPRPDGLPDFLGLTCTDEPALKQSDPALLALRLQHKLRTDPAVAAAAAGQSGAEDGTSVAALLDQPLGWVQDPEQEARKLDSWVDACCVLHQGQASSSTLCSDLVDLEALAQQWPADMAEHVRASSLPDPKQAVDLKAYTRMACSVVDIPASASPIEALHALFSLYLEFQADHALHRRHLFDRGLDHGASLE